MKATTFFKKLAIFSIPFVAFVLLYIYMDPFKVIRNYKSYYTSGEPSYISLNKDFISTQNWLNHYKEYNYDAYILGNSRSMFYQVESWSKYINTPYNKCYHFDASGESLYGIAKKVDFLHQQGAPIKHCLIVVDSEALNQAENSTGHLFLKDPNISGDNKFIFQVESMKAFFDFKFLTSYLDFKFSGKVKDYMKKEFLLDDRPFYYDYVTNEVQQKYFEEMIAKNPADYYEPRKDIFTPRAPKTADPVLKAPHLELLKGMKKVFEEAGTDYKIVISPLYNQVKINPADLSILKSIFGKEQVFDFSGVNALTSDIKNYYETSHYRPHVADSVMKIVYTGGSVPL